MGERILFSIDKYKISDINNSQLAKMKLYICATGSNVHGLNLSIESIKDAVPTLFKKPIVYKYSSITKDFKDHDMEEVPCGYFSETESNIQYEEDSVGRIWLVAEAIIWKIYSRNVIEVFQKDNNRSVSMEIEILEKEHIGNNKFNVKKFAFAAVTLLGKAYRPAISGAKASIIKFSELVDMTEKSFQHILNSETINILKEKMKEHNLLVGMDFSKRVSLQKLKKVWSRAILTNFSDNCSDLNIIALNRIDDFLNLLKNNADIIGFSDFDLLPEKHPKYQKFIDINNFKETEVLLEKFNTINQKEEVQGMLKNAIEKFGLNSAQILEIISTALSSIKYKCGEHEYCKYWVSSFDETYVYAYDNEKDCQVRMPFKIEDLTAIVDAESVEQVIRGGYIPVGTQNENAEIEAVRQEYSDMKAQYEDMCAKYAEVCEKFSEKEKIESELITEKEVFSAEKVRLETDIQEKTDTILKIGEELDTLKVKFSEYETKLIEKDNQIAEKDSQIIAFSNEKKNMEVEKILTKYSQKLSEEEINNFKSTIDTFSSIEDFEIKVKAFVCDKYEDEMRGRSTSTNFSYMDAFTNTNKNKNVNKQSWEAYIPEYLK